MDRGGGDCARHCQLRRCADPRGIGAALALGTARESERWDELRSATPTGPMRRARTALVLVLVGVSGCGRTSRPNSTPLLGRALTAGPPSVRPTPAPLGDPSQE